MVEVLLSSLQTFNTTLLIVHSVAFQIFFLSTRRMSSNVENKNKCFLSTRASLYCTEKIAFNQKRMHGNASYEPCKRATGNLVFPPSIQFERPFFPLALVRFLTYSIKSIQLYVECTFYCWQLASTSDY